MKRITPNNIEKLELNEIIVFGSNFQGAHGGGLARVCHEKFGAEWGVGHGITGQCYAIDTISGLEVMQKNIDLFIDIATAMPRKKFLVTLIGTGIAGYSAEQIAPMFKETIKLKNIYLPIEFWNILSHGQSNTTLKEEA